MAVYPHAPHARDRRLPLPSRLRDPAASAEPRHRPERDGKSNLYRALRLLAETAQGRVIPSLAREGGLPSTLWAGPESFSRAVLRASSRSRERRDRSPSAFVSASARTTSATPSISACHPDLPAFSATTLKSNESASGPDRCCGLRRCSSIVKDRWSSQTGRKGVGGRHLSAGDVRQHDDPLRRPAKHARDAHAARRDARVALLRSLSHRRRARRHGSRRSARTRRFSAMTAPTSPPRFKPFDRSATRTP